jgi:thiol-disulfide isomerase/thioredoxin
MKSLLCTTLFVFTLVGIVTTAQGQTADTSLYLPYEQAYYKALNEQKTLVVVCGASWCGPCQQLKRTLPRYLRDVRDQVVLCYIDVDTDPNAKNHHKAGVVPETIYYSFFQGDLRESCRFTGVPPEPTVIGYAYRAIRQILKGM